MSRSKLSEGKALVRWVLDGHGNKKTEDIDAIIAEDGDVSEA